MTDLPLTKILCSSNCQLHGEPAQCSNTELDRPQSTIAGGNTRRAVQHSRNGSRQEIQCIHGRAAVRRAAEWVIAGFSDIAVTRTGLEIGLRPSGMRLHAGTARP